LFKYLKLKYKAHNITKYVKIILGISKFYFTKNIIIYINQISTRFMYFFNTLRGFINRNNNYIFKQKTIEIKKFIILLKFKNFTKKQKKKPRKKKYILKRIKKYKF